MRGSQMVAVVDIGSIAIRMAISELKANGQWKMADWAERPVALGRDVFSTGNISRETINQSLNILLNFREMLKGWDIDLDEVHIVATSALREARNRDTFIDRVKLKTGFTINVIEGIEENRLTYMAVLDAVKEIWHELTQSNSMIIEVGGGSTEIMLLKHGRMIAAHSMKIGTVRIEPQMKAVKQPARYLEGVLNENIRSAKEILDAELQLKDIEQFIAVGSDARLAAVQTGDKVNHQYTLVKKERFTRFVERLRIMTVEDCVREFQISFNDAEALVPSLLMYRLFLDATSAKRLIVPKVSIREGLLLSITRGLDSTFQKEFHLQVIESAQSLGRKYNFDERHANHVTELALSLFDQLQKEHGLEQSDRLLLNVAALLHDVGTFINASGHHKHGQYIIDNSEIFGLNKNNLRIISNTVRYHRKAKPMPQHISFISLSLEFRITVMKLAAILRVADALDRSHTQRIEKVKIETKGNELLLKGEYRGNLSVEKYGLSKKADLFEDVFGMGVVLF